MRTPRMPISLLALMLIPSTLAPPLVVATTTAAHAIPTSGAVQSDATPSSRSAANPTGLSASKQRTLKRQLPHFAKLPRVAPKSGAKSTRGDAGGPYFVRAKVRLTPWRTGSKHRWADPDRVRYVLEVSKPNVKVRNVTFKGKGQRGRLMATKTTKSTLVAKPGVRTVSIPVNGKVWRSLRGLSVAEQNQRIRLTVEHKKDVEKNSPGHDLTQLGQSTYDVLKQQHSRSGGMQRHENDYLTAILSNVTPFMLNVSFAPLQCVNTTTWSGSLAEGAAQAPFEVLNSERNPDGSPPSAMADLLNATKAGAVAGAKTANALGPAAASEGGIIAVGVDAGIGYWGSILQDIKDNSCASLDALWSSTFYAESIIPSAVKRAKQKGGDFAVGANYAEVNQPLPSRPVLVSQIGNVGSAAWWWDDGNVSTSTDSGVAYAGGLIQTGEYSSGSLWNTVYYQNTTGTDGIKGPAYEGGAAITAGQYQENASDSSEKGWPLNCQVGNWTFVSPWGGANWNIQNGTSSQGNGGTAGFYVDWSLAAVTKQGKVIATAGTPISKNGSGSVSTFSSSNDSAGLFVVDQKVNKTLPKLQKAVAKKIASGVISKAKASGWKPAFACQIMVEVQVPEFALPSGWPLGGDSSNLMWQGSPNATVATPIPPKS